MDGLCFLLYNSGYYVINMHTYLECLLISTDNQPIKECYLLARVVLMSAKTRRAHCRRRQWQVIVIGLWFSYTMLCQIQQTCGWYYVWSLCQSLCLCRLAVEEQHGLCFGWALTHTTHWVTPRSIAPRWQVVPQHLWKKTLSCFLASLISQSAGMHGVITMQNMRS